MTLDTSLDFEPGCFGSLVMFRASAPECVACAHTSACALVVKRSEPLALEYVAKLDALYKTARTDAVRRWWSGRWKRDDGIQRASNRVLAVKRKWSELGANPFLLKYKRNPFETGGSPLYREAFQFIIDAGPFKPRDIAEHLRDKFPDTSKANALSYATLMCEALLSDGILKKEKRGVLCL